ncbi:extracellular protein [Colletotrichum truncatum]|uniref:Extracellular protein n=1 Tax=Colletotrichum truncatum TaxID=5467 RepID=A0ACC3ZGS4_COLTU|nr:extracellular protein [Colletotrichum truncatum]KAF6790500.1 extracellular protein [Colletotrichum truncatum]
MRLQSWLHLFAATVTCDAHMAMVNPPPLKSNVNPNTPLGTADYSYTNPLSGSGSDYPCKGYLSLLGTSEGTPVDTWDAGEPRSVTISGGAVHGGGSCQISLSVDKGRTFKVIHSYIGGCPAGEGAMLKFTVPAETPPTEQAVLAWSWFNNLGNREMYMNCAVIRIAHGGAGSGFKRRPNIFRANINQCRTVESKDLMFPNPGPNVDLNNPGAVPPTGDCETGPGAADLDGSDPDSEPGNDDENEGMGFKPGNDWPPGFKENSTWAIVVGPHEILVLLGVIMLSICLHHTWFSNFL